MTIWWLFYIGHFQCLWNQEKDHLQRRIQNPLKHVRWRVFQKQLTAKTIFKKLFILDVWQVSGDAPSLEIYGKEQIKVLNTMKVKF